MKEKVAAWKPLAKVGVALMIASFPFWGALPFVPLLSMPPARKVQVGFGVLFVAESLFWLGAMLAGKEAMQRWRRRQTSRE